MSLDHKFINNSYSPQTNGNGINNIPTSLSAKKPNAKHKKRKFFVVLLLMVVAVYFFRNQLIVFVSSYKQKQKTEVAGQQTVQSQIIDIGKQYTFPGLDDEGKKRGEVELKITQVELTDQVIVQDKNYTSKNNKVFLIVNLELKNESTKRLNIFPGDMLRLIVDDNEEKKLAPDLHNNYVLVAPISTKNDRVGFVIDKDNRNLKLQVGELEKDKEILKIEF